MKRMFWIFFLAVILVSSNSFAVTKIDPMFNYIDFALERPGLSSSVVKMVGIKSVEGRFLVGAMIKTTDVEIVSQAVEELGGRVKTRLETVITADIPLDAVEELSEMNEVIYIEAAKMMNLKMNYARNDGISNVVAVQDGTGLSQAYTGSGVIVGVIDSAVDCTHADFTGRIMNYWDMALDKVYSAAEIADGTCVNSIRVPAKDIYAYHGTHVAGIAAGANSTYTGVAPAASIIPVRYDAGTDEEIINGIDYIFQRAQEHLYPAVVNLSLGTSLGPHDGTSAFETGLDETLSGKTGRALVCAAGNETVNPNDDAREGDRLGGIHADIDVATGTDIGFQTIVRAAVQISVDGSDIPGFMIDVWMDGGDCTLELDIYDAADTRIVNMSPVSAGNSNKSDPSEIGSYTAYVDFSDSNNANNGKQHALVVVTYTSFNPDSPMNLTYDLIFRSTSSRCTGDAWLYSDVVIYNVFTKDKDGEERVDPDGNYTYSKGDSDSVVTIPSTATNCISVGSFSSRNTWTSKDGEQSQNVYKPEIGATGTPATDLSYYSSLGPGTGPTFSSPRQKPDITAPGEPIISTLSSSCGGASCSSVLGGNAVVATDDIHVKLEGSSMSAPLVSGVVALLFDRNGCLTPAQVKTALTSTAMSDSYTGSSLPNYEWGYGKVDALAAIQSISASDCQPDNPDDDPPTPAAAKKGCSLVKGSDFGNLRGVVLLMLILMATLLYKRGQVLD